MTESLASERHAEIRAALARIVEPLEAEVAKIDERLVEIDDERQELMAARREAAAVIRAADPDRPKTKPGPKANGVGGDKTRVSRERVENLGDWLKANWAEFPDGVTVPELQARTDSPIREKTTANRSLQILAEWGVLRLDGIREKKLDGSTIKGRRPKVYKLVAP